MAGKCWMQVYEAAGHMAFTVRKQRVMKAGAQLTVSFYSAGNLSPWKGVVYI